ncbi:virginiamycin A acetyltransferase [Pseudofulvimonas gallinarii]|uniref:Virginiamycin A acetyltransferase n=2 Tax=Pseudofulvimonas gallinarii TaxID=634155 RepID=A0A4R3LBS7_9GAMM|nr:virginiamycin A acetyltransferase [Pseudofulvimonas gallinarii]
MRRATAGRPPAFPVSRGNACPVLPVPSGYEPEDLSMTGPDPSNPHPMPGFPQVCYIRNTIRNPNIIVGEYTYYDDPENPEDFERNVLYHLPFIGDRLVIGRFCAIARGARFIMNGANHKMDGLSTYPFQIFGNGWEKVMPERSGLGSRGDTVIGNDVWIGYEALIMPGVKIGNGAIVAARSVVASDVPAYTLVGGNPARPIRQRFDPQKVARLEALAWWDWPVETITRHLELIVGADVDALATVAPEH